MLDRLGWARLLSLSGLALSIAGLLLAYLVFGGPWTLAASSLATIAKAIALLLPGAGMAVAGYRIYEALPVALRARTRAPFLILIASTLLPIASLAGLLFLRWSPI